MSPVPHRSLDLMMSLVQIRRRNLLDEGNQSTGGAMARSLQHGPATLIAELQTTGAAAWLTNNVGKEKWKTATRFPLLHTPDGGYPSSEIAALH
jgi:hypothetical protein